MASGSPPVKARCVGPLRVTRDGGGPLGVLGVAALGTFVLPCVRVGVRPVVVEGDD